MTGSRVTVSDPVDLVGHKAAEETPIGAAEVVDHPETAAEAGPAAEEAAAMEQGAEMKDGSPSNPNHMTLTTTTTQPRGRKSLHPDLPEESQGKDPRVTQEIATAMTK